MLILISAVQNQVRQLHEDAVVFAACVPRENPILSQMSTAVVCVIPSEHLIARVFYSDQELFKRLVDPESCFSIAWELLVQLKDGGFGVATLREELPFLNLDLLRVK